ncbi:MAG: HAD family hydrolase [Erysipelotrichaceae bacterium]|nr:HAD family hydrolase [Erysipelotrichaceae bacterium]
MIFVFDIDDTLYDLMAPFEAAYDICLKHKTDVDCLTLFKRSRINSDVVLMKEKAGLISPNECFYERMKMTCDDFRITFSREESNRFESIYREAQNHIELYPEMEAVLDFCEVHQIEMVILTNGNHDNQGHKIDCLNLHRWFDDDHIFISGDIGYHKPEPGAYRYVEKAINVKSDELWYIGDTYESDVQGPHEASWHTIFMNHRKRQHEHNVADFTLTDRKDLIKIIEELIENQSHII